LRVPKSGILPEFGIGVCLWQTPSIRQWRIAMETAASMPQAPGMLQKFTTKSKKPNKFTKQSMKR
jgi:hypothetical protein